MKLKDGIKNDWNLSNEEISLVGTEIKDQNWLESIKLELWVLSDWIRWEVKTKNESLVHENRDVISKFQEILFEKMADNDFVKSLKSKLKNKKLTKPMQWIMVCQTILNILGIKWAKGESLKIDAFYWENSFYALSSYQLNSNSYKQKSWAKPNWLFDKNTLDTMMSDLELVWKIKPEPKVTIWDEVAEVQPKAAEPAPVEPKPVVEKSEPKPWASHKQVSPDILASHEAVNPPIKHSFDKYVPQSYRWLSQEQIILLTDLDETIFQGFKVRFDLKGRPSADTKAWNKKFELLTARGKLDLLELEKWYYNYYAWKNEEAKKHLDKAISLNPQLAEAYSLRWQLERFSNTTKSSYFEWIWLNIDGNYISAFQYLTQLLYSDNFNREKVARMEKQVGPLTKLDQMSLNYYRNQILSTKERWMVCYHLALNYLWTFNQQKLQAKETKDESKYSFWKSRMPSYDDMKTTSFQANKYYKQAQELNPEIKDENLEKQLSQMLAIKKEDYPKFLS